MNGSARVLKSEFACEDYQLRRFILLTIAFILALMLLLVSRSNANNWAQFLILTVGAVVGFRLLAMIARSSR